MSLEISKDELLAVVKEAIQEAVEVHPLSPDEVQWVRLAIKAEAERAALRKAIIEKTLASLAWAAIVGLGYLALHGLIDFFNNHKG